MRSRAIFPACSRRMTAIGWNEPMNLSSLISGLQTAHDLTDAELLSFLTETQDADEAALFAAADAERRKWYGDAVYLRGLIEFTNHCKNNCLYCGIRAGNAHAERYRLTDARILECCAEGYALGYRTFVLQGGEDPFYTDDRICALVSAIAERYPDCRITLSIGEKSRESYQRYYDAGARRCLLRHETASPAHYGKLHPANMSLENRKRCLRDLKAIGYQVGSGFMIGSPYQTPEHLLADIRYLQELQPAMIGVGPYITHSETPFADQPSGDLHFSLRMIALLRLMFPKALIPATTAFGSLHPQGRELALKAGGNVMMPNLSPADVRKLYDLYENKVCIGEEAAQCFDSLQNCIQAAGYRVVSDVGDSLVGNDA